MINYNAHLYMSFLIIIIIGRVQKLLIIVQLHVDTCNRKLNIFHGDFVKSIIIYSTTMPSFTVAKKFATKNHSGRFFKKIIFVGA